MNLRILILGKTGQLGWELNRTAACLGEVLSYDYPHVDFTQPGQLQALVLETKPKLIFNAVAYTAVDRAELEQDVARIVNATAVGVLAEAARKIRAGFVHYSTDFVFDGKKGTAYCEDDVPHPLNVYGQTKLEGEQAVEAVGGTYLTLRTSWVYSTRRDSFVTKVLEWARRNETVKVVSDQVGSPTWARLLAEISTYAVVMGGNDPLGWMQERKGLYHLGGDGSASRYDWAQAILANDPKPDEQKIKRLEPSLTSEFPAPAVRPAMTPLNCDKFESVFGLRLPDWRDCLRLAMSTQ
jgi:dTDP-4-dehydrorhamnose reductase